MMKAVKTNGIVNFSELSLERLIEYISGTHHNYLKEIITSVKVHLKTIVKVDGNMYPEILIIGKRTEELNALLEQHLNMEEFILFPYLKNLLHANDPDPTGNTRNLILKIKKEHVTIFQIMKDIREHSNNYTASPASSPALKLFYAKMFDLEQDIHRHIFIEEQIFFPKLQEYRKRNLNIK
jgi:regulator of cell morphogenesis and NO signaling